MGRNWSIVTVPRASGECVRSSTSHAWPMVCIHVPVREIIWPKKNSR